MKKKILAALTAVSLLVSQTGLFSTAIFAADNDLNISITSDTVDIRTDTVASVVLSVENVTMLDFVSLDVGYDSNVMTLAAITNGDKTGFYSEGSLTYEQTNNPVTLVWLNTASDPITNMDGTLRLNFNIKDGAVNGDYEISLKINEEGGPPNYLDNTTYDVVELGTNLGTAGITSKITVTGSTNKNEYTGTTPAAPTVTNIKATGFNVTVSTGNEFTYSTSELTDFSACTWYKNGEVTGLNPNTKYYVYQRVAETDTVKASPVSEKAEITTLMLNISDVIKSVSIGTQGTAGTVLTPEITYNTGYSASDLGVISYAWSNGTTAAAYTVTADDVRDKTSFDVTISAANVTGTIKSNSVTAGMAENTDTVVKPVIKSTTPDGFIIEAQAGYEYYISDTDSSIAVDAVWTTSAAVTGKTPNTTYYVYGRIAATDTVNASAPSAATVIRVPNNDASIKSLATTSGAISPSFSYDTYNYSITVPYGETITMPVIALNDTKANYEFVRTASDFNTNNISEIKVTAENGVDIQTYTLTYSEINAVLSSLTVNGEAVSGFSPDTLAYAYELSYAEWKNVSVQTYTVAATASKNTSTIAISDTGAFTLDCSDPDAGVTKEVSITVTDTENNKSNVYKITFKVLACGHTDITEIIDTPADCENDGSKHTECGTCGKITSTDIIPALGHTWSFWTQIDDTENYERVCSVCNKQEIKTADDISHTHIFNGITEIIIPATCTDEGSQKIWCSVESCPEFVTESINKTAHTPGTPNVINSTCTETGLQTVSCTVCGTVISSEVIPVSDHSYSDTWVNDESGHWHICTACGTASETAAHIENSGVITTPATSFTDGLKTYSCTICGYETRTETIPATGNTGYDPNKPIYPTYPDYTPSTPSTPITPTVSTDSQNKPKIDGNRNKSGWEAISNVIAETADGGTVTVDMDGTNELPKNILEIIQGRNIDLVLKMSNGMIWTINGKTVTDPHTVNMGATKNTKRIPVDVIDSVKGDNSTIQLSLSYSGDLGFIATLTVNLGNKYNGNYANLFYYNKSESVMEFVDFDTIKDGKANLTFTHASDYAIVIDSSLLTDYEDVSSGAGTESIPTKNSSAVYVVCIIMLAGVAVGITIKAKKYICK